MANKNRTWPGEKSAKRACRFNSRVGIEDGVLQELKKPREREMMNSIGSDRKGSCQGQGPFSLGSIRGRREARAQLPCPSTWQPKQRPNKGPRLLLPLFWANAVIQGPSGPRWAECSVPQQLASSSNVDQLFSGWAAKMVLFARLRSEKGG